ncbi:helix-turn-helix transcriptional regulator [Niallia oryzisoli]|uniref:Helix-turn-helix transcriptional regulator n=1 Tax=Niallia oryzisoli TaxID=1737571 RepID=A0ABZ2CES8_9BACI
MQVFILLIKDDGNLLKHRGFDIISLLSVQPWETVKVFEMKNDDINGFINYIKDRKIGIDGRYFEYEIDYCTIDPNPSVNILVKECFEFTEEYYRLETDVGNYNIVPNGSKESSQTVEGEKFIDDSGTEKVDKVNKAIITRIKELAKERGKTVAETAALGGINQSTISEIIHGRSKSPKISTISMYCKGCNISLAEFFSSSYFNY